MDLDRLGFFLSDFLHGIWSVEDDTKPGVHPFPNIDCQVMACKYWAGVVDSDRRDELLVPS